MKRGVDILVLKSNKKKKKHMKVEKPLKVDEIVDLMELLNSFDDVDVVEIQQRSQKELERFYSDDNRTVKTMEFQGYKVSVYVKVLSVDIVFKEGNSFKYVLRKLFN